MIRIPGRTPVRVPVQSLSAEAVRGVVEAFVLREGTEYGHRDFSLDEKRVEVERQLARGDAEIWFDPETGTTDIRLERESGPKAGDEANGRDGRKDGPKERG